MVVETYQLSTLRDDVLEEFGKDITDADLKAKAERKINDAMLWIAKKRKDWPWRLKEYFAAVSPGTAITADVVQGSFVVANPSPISALDQRKIMVDVGGTPGTFGYLVGVVDLVGPPPNYTLQSAYLGASENGKDLTLMEGVLALPTDFDRMSTLEGVTGQGGQRKFLYRSPLEFEKIKRAGNLVGLNDFIYTVKPDPLTIDFTSMYLMIFPYLNEYVNLHGNYWRNIEKLVNDSDVPVIPVDDRLTLLKFSYWFMAQHLREDKERVLMYKADALESLQDMTNHYELGDEPENLDDDGGLDIDFIPGPAGYPPFTNIGASRG